MKGKILLSLIMVGLLTAGAYAYSGYSNPINLAQYNPGPGSAYYLGLADNGNVIHGNMNGGLFEWNRTLDANGDGVVGDPVQSGPSGANASGGTKAGWQLGNYIFWGSSNNAGVYRTNRDFTNGDMALKATDDGSEAVCSDGTYLYGNDDYERGEIHKWSVSNTASDFTLTEMWTSDTDGEGLETGFGRIRQLTPWGGAIYFGDYNGTALGKVDTATGTVTVVGNASGTPATHVVIRYGDEGFSTGRDELVHFYSIAGSGTSETWTEDFTSALAQVGKDKYGMAVTGNGQEATTMWVVSQSTGADGSGGYTLASYELRHNGDADLDGDVDGDDLNVILGNWGQSGASMTWAAGDFNGDDVINGDDLNMLLGEWGWSAPSAPAANVPEPVTILLSLIGFAGLLRKRS